MNRKKFSKAVFIIFIISLILEIFVFNFRFFTGPHGKETVIDNSNIDKVTFGEGIEYDENNKWTDENGELKPSFKITDKKEAYIEIEDINEEVDNIYIDIPNVNERNYTSRKTVFKIWATDEANALFFGLPERDIVRDVEKSKYVNFNLSGKSEKIKIEIKGKNNDRFVFNKIKINADYPFFFSFIRLFSAFLIILIFYMIRPASCFYKYKLNLKSVRQRIALCVVIAAHIAAFVGISFINPKFVNINIEHHLQYQQLTNAILNGHVYLDKEPSEILKNMENPYDTNLRKKEFKGKKGEAYLWDRAYYNGKYYVYFGIVPVLTYYLPFKCITGENFPTFAGIAVTAILFMFAALAFIYKIMKRYFKDVPFLLYILLSFFFIDSCGIIYLLKRPDFYSLPIIMGLMFSIAGLYFWMSSVKYKGEREDNKFLNERKYTDDFVHCEEYVTEGEEPLICLEQCFYNEKYSVMSKEYFIMNDEYIYDEYIYNEYFKLYDEYMYNEYFTLNDKEEDLIFFDYSNGKGCGDNLYMNYEVFEEYDNGELIYCYGVPVYDYESGINETAEENGEYFNSNSEYEEIIEIKSDTKVDIENYSGLDKNKSGVKEREFNGFIKWRLMLGSLCMALVAGCRPQMLMGSFLVIPLFFKIVFKDRKLFSKDSIKETALFIIPYIVVAAGLMYYNYIRFDSIFDFGANYNLTTNDMTKRGFVLGRSALGIFTYLFQPAVYSPRFPFISDVWFYTNYMGVTIHEFLFGGILFNHFLLCINLFVLKFKNSLKQKGLLYFCIMSIVFGVIIVIADTQLAGILQRYMVDFAWLMFIPGIILILTLLERVNDYLKKHIYTVLICGLALSFYYDFATIFFYGDDALYNTNPTVHYYVAHLIQFWL